VSTSQDAVSSGSLNAPPADPTLRHLAVLLVHGIGDFRAGSVTTAAVKGLRAELPDLRIGANDRRPLAAGGRNATLVLTRLAWRSATIDLLEFYWAEIGGKIRLRKPVAAAATILGVIREFPSMAVDATTPGPLKWLAAAIGNACAVLLSIWVITLAGSLIELALWPDLWLEIRGNEVRIMMPTSIIFSSTADPLFWNNGYYFSFAAQIVALTTMSLPVWLFMAFLVVLVLAAAFRHLRALGVVLRTSAASGVVTLLLLFTAAIFYVGLIVFVATVLDGTRGLALLMISASFGAILGVLLAVAIWIVNLLRDVVHYLGTDSDGRPLPDNQAIHDALATVIDQQCQASTLNRLVIVCHSLGTVIVTDLLRSRACGSEQRRSVPIDLVTAGSPIRRLIVRLLPHRLPRPLEIRRELAGGPLPVVRWFNAYRPLDAVGMRLVSGADARDPERGILECPLSPSWLWPWGHSNYWADRRFTRLVAERVVAPILRQNASA
jgi:hypothetical protein